MQDKVVIITGASSGIGKALALECLRQGARVVLAARKRTLMEDLASAFEPGQSLVAPTDVSKEEDCRLLIRRSVEAFGRIDVLINNAGISMRALFAETEISVLKRLMDVNFWGMVYCTREAMPYLLKSQGSVVGVSSIAGYKGLPARAGYSASKFAMQGFLESLRIENLHSGLHVLIACPGFTASGIRNRALAGDGTEQGESPRDEQRMMSAEEVARHILRALGKRKHTLILTRQGKLSVWLNKFLPSLTDRLVYKHLAKEPDAPIT